VDYGSSALTAMSIPYLEALQRRYWQDPGSIDEGWRRVFDVLRDLDAWGAARSDDVDALALLHWIREHGHLHADLDPLTASETAGALETVPPGSPFGRAAPEAVAAWRRLCASGLAVELGHMDDENLRAWICDRLEVPVAPISPAALDRAVRLILAGEEFEAFLAVKFPGKKRFGLEGSELTLAILERILARVAADGATDVVIGTMHRGRLSIMSNILGKDLPQLLAEFKGMHPFPGEEMPADVPYHLGLDGILGAAAMRVSLAANPSHLEAVNPVSLGQARGRQDRAGGSRHVVPILIHTDASVIGQGVVAECLQLSAVPGFTVGGTIHLIINNQIGFTTGRDEARSSRYCTGAWKAIDSLILHVNGDRLEAGLQAADLAVDFRQSQGRDAVIDINCYRRNGHNEIDEPRFTQPVLYRKIETHPSVGAAAAAVAIGGRLRTAEDIAAEREEVRASLAEAYEAANELVAGRTFTRFPHRPPTSTHVGIRRPAPGEASVTGIDPERRDALLRALSVVPVGFQLDPKLDKVVRARALAPDAAVNWPLAEALAFGAVLMDGVGVRFTGQDIVRGAFSQRHFAVTDVETGARYVHLEHLRDGQGRFEVINSPLSEYAVLGFEYGYSLERPDRLVIWEAQFGDFANGAQIIIDQFITSGRDKWNQHSGLVLLLPHGLEGQGPEHSSARPERLLQLAARNNIEIAHPSTPANYFHLLRRQVGRTDRKPLLIMGPKSMLRLPAEQSPLTEFGTDRGFRPVIASEGAPGGHAILCSGKIAYDVERALGNTTQPDASVVRLEMLYPFPAESLRDLFRQIRPSKVTWLQEEPANMGAWSYVDRRLERVLAEAGLAGTVVRSIARPEASSPAGSFHGDHENDQKRLVAEALGL